jgi:DNA-binding beta-propeller fold protein YncE
VAAIALAGAAAPAAQAAPFVYVTNEDSASVSQFNSATGGLLAPLSPPAVVSGPGSRELAISPDAANLYVTSRDGNTVSQYDVGPSGKLISKSPPSVATDELPFGIDVSPDGRSAYVANFIGGCCGGTISQYDVGPGGKLAPKSPPTVFGDADPFAVAVSPDGKSVYVTNFKLEQNGSVSQFNVGPGGKLTPKSPPAVPTGEDPGGLAVSPDGRSVYVANNGSGTISQFDVGPGGKLVPKSPPTILGGGGPARVAISPDGRNVYVTNLPRESLSSATISQYSVGAGGRLVPKSPAAVPTGATALGLAVSPNGRSVYVANNDPNTISQYSVGPGGKLKPKNPPRVGAGGGPSSIAITPPVPGWEGRVTNAASGCSARVQVPYRDAGRQATAYTEVSCPRPTRLTIRSRLRSSYRSGDVTVAQRGCARGCMIDEPKGTRTFRLTCPKSSTPRDHQRYYSDILLFPGTNAGAATKERSRAKALSPLCAR